MVVSTELKEGTQYLIRYKDETDNTKIYHGTFEGYGQIGENKVSCVFINIMDETCERMESVIFYNFKNYNFYDFKKIINAPKSIERMERRALHIILRQIIGDPNFEW